MLTDRSMEAEIMDDLNCSGAVLDQTLRELEVINKWLGGNAVTLGALSSLLEGHPAEKSYSIVDVGCGGGDMARHIYDWGQSRDYTLAIIGVDANPNVVSFARRNVPGIPSVMFQTMNIFESEFQNPRCDLVIGTLFFHHFSREELIRFFRGLKSHVSIGFIINDIHRHPLAFYSIRFLTRLFSRSAMVRYDAPLSVRRAFTRKELEDILTDSGYENFTIRWKWAFRWQVVVRMN